MELNPISASITERPADLKAFLGPLEFLRSDHQHQHSFCKGLCTVADDLLQPGHEELSADLFQFAVIDLSSSIEDREALLAPAIARRCSPQDKPMAIVSHMLRQNRSAAKLISQTLEGLDRLAGGSLPDRPLDFIISALQLTQVLEQYLDWEEQVLLPLAACRLTKEDQEFLSVSMSRRRGVRAL